MNSPFHYFPIAALIILLTGCTNDRVEDLTQTNKRVYDKTFAGTKSVYPSMTLCELIERSGPAGAGLYEVRSLVGYTEPDLYNEGNRGGFTYVELTLVEEWSPGAPESPVLRIVGGPVSEDISVAWTVDLEVGKIYGMILKSPEPENRGKHILPAISLFDSNMRDDNQRYVTNEMYFEKEGRLASDVRSIVRDIYTSDECPHEIHPRSHEPDNSTDDDHSVLDEEIGTDDEGL